MSAETHSQIASFIWGICNLLRGSYKRNEHRKVILPLTVLRRFDCILAPTKAAVLKEHAAIKAKPGNIVRHKLCSITGHAFYNLSKLDRERDVRLSAPELKAVLAALGERDDTAEICRDRDGQPEPDADLRDTETVPLKESIEAYFKREVLPHVPDAWIDTTKTKVGYEIPLNRHFYRYEPPRPLEVIETGHQAFGRGHHGFAQRGNGVKPATKMTKETPVVRHLRRFPSLSPFANPHPHG